MKTVRAIHYGKELSQRRLALDDVLAATRSGGVRTEIVLLTDGAIDERGLLSADLPPAGWVVSCPLDDEKAFERLERYLREANVSRAEGPRQPVVSIVGAPLPAPVQRLRFAKRFRQLRSLYRELGFQPLRTLHARERPGPLRDSGPFIRVRASLAGQRLATTVDQSVAHCSPVCPLIQGNGDPAYRCPLRHGAIKRHRHQNTNRLPSGCIGDKGGRFTG